MTSITPTSIITAKHSSCRSTAATDSLAPSRYRSGLQPPLRHPLSAPLPVSPAPCCTLDANQIPIVPGLPLGAPFPAGSFFGDFRTPARMRVERSTWPASETLHNC
jgi:hypothetical protein